MKQLFDGEANAKGGARVSADEMDFEMFTFMKCMAKNILSKICALNAKGQNLKVEARGTPKTSS